MRWIFLIALVAGWFWLGDPPKTVANWVWPDEPAPWETVDAVYYPDRQNLRIDLTRRGLPNLESCRDWAYDQADAHGDPNFLRSDYECGIGYIEDMVPGGPRIYRITAE